MQEDITITELETCTDVDFSEDYIPLVDVSDTTQSPAGTTKKATATNFRGPANTLSVGTVVQGTQAEATITGESPNQTLNLVLPKGEKGDTGPAGPISDITAGTNIIIDKSNPNNPIISSSGSGTGNNLQIDSTETAGTTKGGLIGLVDGINKVFTTSLHKYVSGSLVVSKNGQTLSQGTNGDYAETNPLEGTFTMTEAPIAGDRIEVLYQHSTGVSGDADTLDGYHLAGILNMMYPIGLGFIAYDDTDYSNRFGFTWEKTCVGRAPVGMDASQTEFNTMGKQGGSKHMQRHRHGIYRNWNKQGFSTPYGEPVSGWGIGDWEQGSEITGVSFEGTGDSGNLQPYEVVNFWKRVA